MTIKLSNYPSRYFPVKAVFKIGSVEYSFVFETIEKAKTYFTNRYFPLHIKFKEVGLK